MKKVLALGAMAVVLGMSLSYGAPVLAVSVDSTAVATDATAASSTAAASLVAAAVARAEEAIAKTANATVNVKEVAAMREYLQGWVAQARTLDVAQLTASQLKELVAALDEGARGLRMTAGVDRKVASAANDNAVATGSVAEPRTVKTTEVAKVAETMKTVEVAKVAEVSEAASAAKVKTTVAKAEVATTAATVEYKSDVLSALEVAEMNAMATLATAQVKKPTVAAVAENDEVDVPKTGASDEEEQASTAVRGMGLVLGGAVVLAAAAGAVLIVKRMKRGL